MKAPDVVGEDRLTGEIIGAAIAVHRFFGRGLLESIDEKALTHELELRGVSVVCQQSLPVRYEDFRLDLLVGGDVLVELKNGRCAARGTRHAASHVSEVAGAQTGPAHHLHG